MHHVVDGAGLTHHVESPQACVCVAGVEGLEAVAQISLTGHLSQFTGQILGSQRSFKATMKYSINIYHKKKKKQVECLRSKGQKLMC